MNNEQLTPNPLKRHSLEGGNLNIFTTETNA